MEMLNVCIPVRPVHFHIKKIDGLPHQGHLLLIGAAHSLSCDFVSAGIHIDSEFSIFHEGPLFSLVIIAWNRFARLSPLSVKEMVRNAQNRYQAFP